MFEERPCHLAKEGFYQIEPGAVFGGVDVEKTIGLGRQPRIVSLEI